ncbi:DUF5301 domain-containing protein [Paenibacillus odorifer]|uniref:DUF5301 domain-containing protein n=1 Tax=Paenibacillus odorifer TaxID=189426 RepID=A0A1R0XZG8_9BACL|nr:DUF5301 domain-containing protein [Paenibacillus odorifer]OMD40483.1 hypothetical protein BSK52_14015 [Paenibacillus odorifer]
MKKTNPYIVFLVVFIIGFWSITLYHSYNSFKNIILDRIDTAEITSIEILKSSNDEQVEVEDPKEIEKIIHEFSDVKLRRSNAADKPTETYWISIRVNKALRFGMNLTDTNFLHIIDLASNNKYHSGGFKITSKFDGQSITSLFK